MTPCTPQSWVTRGQTSRWERPPCASAARSITNQPPIPVPSTIPQLSILSSPALRKNHSPFRTTRTGLNAATPSGRSLGGVIPRTGRNGPPWKSPGQLQPLLQPLLQPQRLLRCHRFLQCILPRGIFALRRVQISQVAIPVIPPWGPKYRSSCLHRCSPTPCPPLQIGCYRHPSLARILLHL